MINNKGFGIERQIHGLRSFRETFSFPPHSRILGKEASYNDVPAWDWQNLLTTLGAKPGSSQSYSIFTPRQLQDLLKEETFQSAKKLQLVEVHMQPLDAPRALLIQAALVRVSLLLSVNRL